MQELRERSFVVDIVTKCHAAKENFGAGCQTIDHWVPRYVQRGQPRCHYLFVDEISRVGVRLWKYLSLARTRVSMVLCGDFKQFPAINDHWNGTRLIGDSLLEESQLLYDLVGGNRFVLRANRRSDPRLFNFYTALDVSCTPQELRAYLQDARSQFPVRDDGSFPTHLVMPHRERLRLNAESNLREYAQKRAQPTWSDDDFLFIPAPEHSSEANVPQDMWIWPGLRLIGAGGSNGRYAHKGCFYFVEKIGEQVTLVDARGATLELSPEQVGEHLRLSYAITYASCQGLTLRGRVRLHTRSPHFTTRHLYVGSSRATSADLLEVV